MRTRAQAQQALCTGLLVHTLSQALGVLLYVLVYGKLPFDGESKLSILFGKYTLPPGKPSVLVDLIKDLLVTDPEHRPDITQVRVRRPALCAAWCCNVRVRWPRPICSVCISLRLWLTLPIAVCSAGHTTVVNRQIGQHSALPCLLPAAVPGTRACCVPCPREYCQMLHRGVV